MVRYPELPTVLVNAPHWTPRLEAALEWTFTSVLGLGWERMDKAAFEASGAPWKLSYGGPSGGPGCWIEPEGLLDGTELRAFPPRSDTSDVLALVFWMGSRMEEFMDTAARDQHGRFNPDGCVSMVRGWIGRPVCEEWSFQLGGLVLGEDWPEHQERLRKEFAVDSTLDVDSAFAFRGKGPWRTGAAFGRDVLSGQWSRAVHRFRACRGLDHDPYDTFDEALDLHAARGMQPTWFFLLSRFGTHDKGVGANSKALRGLMHRMEGLHPGSVQWHPGYTAAGDEEALSWEFEAFKEIMGRPPCATRQHYLRMIPGTTRRRLIELGIEEDHTEGHANVAGFRGGFSRPRPWYDLENETLTGLMLLPFAAMDATLNRYMKLTPDEVVPKVSELMDAVKSTGGTFRLLWHNETLASQGEWNGWGAVYPNVLEALSMRRG